MILQFGSQEAGSSPSCATFYSFVRVKGEAGVQKAFGVEVFRFGLHAVVCFRAACNCNGFRESLIECQKVMQLKITMKSLRSTRWYVYRRIVINSMVMRNASMSSSTTVELALARLSSFIFMDAEAKVFSEPDKQFFLVQNRFHKGSHLPTSVSSLPSRVCRRFIR